MTPEEFEKYWKKIIETCTMFSLEGGVDEVYIPSCFRTAHTKTQMKEILEEIYQKGYDKCSKDLNDLSDGKLKLYKEAKP